MTTELPLVIAAVFGLGAPPVLAQPAPPDPASDQTIPENDQALPQQLPEEQPSDDGAGRSDSLGKRLDRSGGVIKAPTGVDPGMVKPAPKLGPNSMPVIPPPGTPGGRPGPQAK